MSSFSPHPPAPAEPRPAGAVSFPYPAAAAHSAHKLWPGGRAAATAAPEKWVCSGPPQCLEPPGSSWPCCSAEASGAARRSASSSGSSSSGSSSSGGSHRRISKEVQSRHGLHMTPFAGAPGPSRVPSSHSCRRGTAFLLCP